MAMIIFDNHQPISVSPSIGAMVWRVKEGLAEPQTLRQAKFVRHVREVYLNPDTAPQDYLERYKPKQRVDHRQATIF